MLIVDHLETDIGNTNILRDVSVVVPEGAVCGIIGRNGAGKTTLLRSIMGVLPAGHGLIEIDGKDVTAVPAHERVQMGIGYMPEDRRLVTNFTVEENISLPAWANGRQDISSRLDWVYGIMPEVGERRRAKVNQLSGGQQKMVTLARAMMGAIKLLLLDEPFEGLAPALARRLAEVMSSLKDEGMSVLIADSNEQHVVDLLDNLYRIERGEIVGARN